MYRKQLIFFFFSENGYVDYEEFEEFVNKNNLCRAPELEVSEEMRDAFKVFDKDNNGFIDVSEFKQVMTTIGAFLCVFVCASVCLSV